MVNGTKSVDDIFLKIAVGLVFITQTTQFIYLPNKPKDLYVCYLKSSRTLSNLWKEIWEIPAYRSKSYTLVGPQIMI